MNNKKSTKRTLVSSVLSLILCLAMLIGTTFAWFTDNVTSGKNRIQAGNLDVAMSYKNTSMTDWEDVEAPTSPDFFKDINGDQILWEPGAVAYANFKVENKGTLALKYSLETIVAGCNYTADGKSLADVLTVKVIKGTSAVTYATREDAVAAAKGSTDTLKSFAHVNTNMEASATDYFTVVLYWEPSSNDNDFNVNPALWIDIELSLVATQAVNEEDSFNNLYDADAEFVDPWDGTVADELVTDEETKTVTISTAAELALFAQEVNGGNNFRGWTVLLTDDINLDNQEWEPIGPNADAANKFAGTFDGQYNTIYNLSVNQGAAYHAAGLFGALNGTVKNLNVENANIVSLSSGDPTDNGIAVIAGSIYTTGAIDNCHVTNASVSGNRYVAGIAGYVYGSITNCSVTDSFIVASCDNLTGEWNNGDKTGGIAGYFASENTYKVAGNTVADTTIVGYRDLGGIAGYAADRVTNNKVSNVTVVQNDAHNYKNYTSKDEFDVGSIVGDGVVHTSNTGEANILYTSDGKIAIASDKESLATSINNVQAGGTVMLTDDVDYGTNQLQLDKNVTLDLNGKEINTAYTYGGISLNNGASIKNGTINHTKTVAAIKVLGTIGSIEDVTINVTPIEGKVITGIQVVNANKSIESIKNVTITGATQGIEVKDCSPSAQTTPAIGLLENVTIDATDTGMIVNGYIGKMKNCDIKGANIGINMLLKGEYKVALDLEDCTVTGGEAGIWAHDEKGISNTTNCSLTLTYDAETVINGGLKWDFEEECESVITLKAPSGN